MIKPMLEKGMVRRLPGEPVEAVAGAQRVDAGPNQGVMMEMGSRAVERCVIA